MAEEATSGFDNKKLLLVAVFLGVLFVILFNWQKVLAGRERQQNTVYIVQVAEDLRPGEVLTQGNTRRVPIQREYAENMTGIVRYDQNFEAGLGTEQVLRSVKKDSYLQINDIGVAGDGQSLSDELEDPLYRVVSIEVDPTDVPALFVARGDRVDLYGTLSVAGQPSRRHLLIEAVKVLGVGNQPAVQGGRSSFHSLQIQLPADIVPQWMELTRRLDGPVVPAGRKRGRLQRGQLDYPYNERDLEMGGRIVPEVAEALENAPSNPGGFDFGPSDGGSTPNF